MVIRDNEKATCMLKDVAVSGDKNVIRKKLRNFKIERPHYGNSSHMEYEKKRDTGNNRDNWNHFKIN